MSAGTSESHEGCMETARNERAGVIMTTLGRVGRARKTVANEGSSYDLYAGRILEVLDELCLPVVWFKTQMSSCISRCSFGEQ
jgi:hypothetical protein